MRINQQMKLKVPANKVRCRNTDSPTEFPAIKCENLDTAAFFEKIEEFTCIGQRSSRYGKCQLRQH